MKTKPRKRFWILSFFIMILFIGTVRSFGARHPCCPDDPELSYLLDPKPSQRFQYLVRYETFFSTQLGKKKGFFIILPEDFFQNGGARYPVLYLLHGYNFHRTGRWWNVQAPEQAKKVLCREKEEEYHWLLHQDIAVIAYAMTDTKSQTHGDLLRNLERRLEDLSNHGGLTSKDYAPQEIAQSIVFHNLLPGGSLNDPYRPIEKMILILPDGDNGFYTDENKGRALFPETKSQKACDDFYPGEALNYSLFPFLYMKPGALGKHESYFLELLQYVDTRSSYAKRSAKGKGIGGFSMGGFGAIKLALKYPDLFHSVSSQSGLLDIELLKNKWMLKVAMPEFLEVFGHLEPKRLPSSSTFAPDHIGANNPLALMRGRGIKGLPSWLYFDYGENESYDEILQGNGNVEKLLNERSHRVPAQTFNGRAMHNYQFWRSRSGVVLRHHSDVFRKMSLDR